MLKKKSILKIAAMSVVAAFSFGLTLSLINPRNRNAQTVYGEDASTTWSYNSNNKTLQCGSVSTYPSGFIDSTTQTSVVGLGAGQYEITYNVQGYASGSMQSSTDDFGNFTLVFIGGSYEKLSDVAAPYGIITAYPNDISGLDTNTAYEIYVSVQPSGDMNEQGGGTSDEFEGAWTYYENSKELFYDYITQDTSVPYVTSCTQTSVTGLGGGAYQIVYNINGYQANESHDGETSVLETLTINFENGSYQTTDGTGGHLGIITAYPDYISGLSSNTAYEIYVNVQPSGDMNEQSSEPAGTWTLSNGALSFQYTDWQTNGYVNETRQTMVYGYGNGLFEITYEFYGDPPGATSAGTSEKLGGQTIQITWGYWTSSQTGGYGTIEGYPRNVDGLDSSSLITLTVNVQYSGTMNESVWRVINNKLYDVGTSGSYIYTITNITWNNSENGQNGTGEAILDVSYSIDGENRITQVFQINFPIFSPTLESTSGATTGTISGTSDALNEPVTLNLDNVSYIINDASQGSTEGWMYSDEILSYYAPGFGTTFTYGETGVPYIVATTAIFESVDSSLKATIEFAFFDVNGDEVPVQYETFELMGGSYASNGDGTYIVYGLSRMFEFQVVNLTVSSISALSVSDGWYFDEVSEGLVYFSDGEQLARTLKSIMVYPEIVELTYKDGQNANSYVYLDPASYNEDTHYVIGQIQDTEVEVRIYINVETVDIEYYEDTVEYTVSFDANGGEGTMEPITVTDGTFEVPGCDFTYDGYVFSVWADEAGEYYEVGQVREISDNITLYAQWDEEEQPNNYIVSFNANGGEGTMEEIETDNGMFNVPECEFTYENHSFLYWMTSDGTIFNAGDPAEISSDITLIAQWESTTPISYTVAFDANGGEGRMEPITVTGGTFEVPQCEFTYENHTFVVWADESGEFYEPGTVVEISNSFVLYAQWKEALKPDVPVVTPEVPIKEETIVEINSALEDMSLSEEQVETINNAINDNKEFISDDTGNVIAEALKGTTIDESNPEVAEAQKELIVTVVETGIAVDSNKAGDIEYAKEIDKALPDNAQFSVEGEINEFYVRQMYELFGGQSISRAHYRSEEPTYKIDTDTQGREGQEAVDYLANEQSLYENMVDFVDSGVDHMSKSSLKLRKCSGESVTVHVKSYVTVVKVSSYREFDKEAADKEFVEAVYKAILLSMQNEVISILEKDHKPSSNAEKEAQYNRELEAVKDIETFEIMVTEVLRQKYVALTGIEIADVEEFHPIYWEIFKAWALDEPSPYPITLEELTQTTIDQSASRANTFTARSDLSAGEWGFIGGIVGGAALLIAAAAILPGVIKNYKLKMKEAE